jgi:DNA-binding MurR/RpiR family transcriptional regulator
LGFRTVLEQKQLKLTTSEERVASTLLTAPQECLILSAAQLAERASVHESTVIRFAQKLGYEGYPELRADLAVDVQRKSDMHSQRWIKAVEPYGLSALVQEQLEVIAQLPNHVSQESVDAATKALLTAHRVFIYGVGVTRFLVEFMDRKLRRMGFEVVDMRRGGKELADDLATFRSNDVLLAFAFESQREEASRLIHLTRINGATSILVSDLSGVLFEPSPTILLAAPRGTPNRHPFVVPLFICYILEYSLGHQAQSRIGPVLDNVAALERIVTNGSVSHE